MGHEYGHQQVKGFHDSPIQGERTRSRIPKIAAKSPDFSELDEFLGQDIPSENFIPAISLNLILYPFVIP